MSDGQGAKGGRFSRRLPWWSVLLSAGVCLALGVAAGWWTRDWRVQPQSSASPTIPPLTAVVTIGRPDTALLAEVVSSPVPVAKVRSVGRVTAVPKVGTTVVEGSTALEVDYRPVVVLAGARPAIRELSAGVVGPDCAQLNAALVRLKLLPAGGNDTCTAETIKAWGRLVASGGRPETVIREGWIVFVPQLPARIGSVSVAVGDGPHESAVALTSPQPGLSVIVDANDATLLPDPAAVELIAPSGERRVAKVAGRTLAASGAVELQLQANLPAQWSGLSLRASITPAGQQGKPGLLVPRAALQGQADGTARVQVLGTDGATREVPVTVIAFDRSMAQVKGDLGEHDRVLIGGAG